MSKSQSISLKRRLEKLNNLNVEHAHLKKQLMRAIKRRNRWLYYYLSTNSKKFVEKLKKKKHDLDFSSYFQQANQYFEEDDLLMENDATIEDHLNYLNDTSTSHTSSVVHSDVDSIISDQLDDLSLSDNESIYSLNDDDQSSLSDNESIYSLNDDDHSFLSDDESALVELTDTDFSSLINNTILHTNLNFDTSDVSSIITNDEIQSEESYYSDENEIQSKGNYYNDKEYYDDNDLDELDAMIINIYNNKFNIQNLNLNQFNLILF